MAFSEIKSVVIGCALTCFAFVLQPVLADAASQPDGVMGQSLEDETTYRSAGLLQLSSALLGASTSYTEDFLDSSFTTEGEYTDATYYHRAEYEECELLNGIDVSWWQGGGKGSSSTNLDWELIHDAGIDFAFVRVGSRDTSDGSIYEDTCADAHITAALENDINIGLYIFSQALDEDEAIEEAEFVLDKIDQYGWDVTMPIVIDREKGSYSRLTAGTLTKDEETEVIQAFADTIVDAGYQAYVYASYSWINNYIDTDSLYDCGIWMARYNNTTTSNSKKGTAYADISYDYEFWQYSSTARVDGYSGNLDADFWYLDTAVKTKGVTVTGTTGSAVSLKWNKAASGVSGYAIYRYDEDAEKYVCLKKQTGRTYTDTDVEEGESYLYKVRCYWSVGGVNYYGTYSDVVSADIAPAKVTGLATDARSSSSLTLTWDEAAGADGYCIYMYSEDSESFEKIGETEDSVSYKVTGLDSAREYYFKVCAWSDTGNGKLLGNKSSEHADCTKPGKVSELSVETGSASSVVLTWKKVSRATGYRIYRLNESGEYEKIATVKSAKNVTYTDTGLLAGTEYTYKVRAYKSYNGEKINGGYSEEKSAVTKPAKVKKLTLSTKSSAVTLSWKKSGKASGYQIYRLNTRTGKYEKVATVKGASATSYKDTKLTKGKTYSYKVRAYKTFNGTKYCGAFSAAISVKVK